MYSTNITVLIAVLNVDLAQLNLNQGIHVVDARLADICL